MAAQPGTTQGLGPDHPEPSDTLATPFVKLLPVAGASITVFSAEGAQSTICATDDLAATLERIQFELGEGPHWQALKTGQPVMIPDVRSHPASDWPFFAEALSRLPARALFAIPLLIGAAVVGVVDLHRVRPGALAERHLETALSLARQVAGPAVLQAIRGAESDTARDAVSAPALRREVHQAVGMILVQLDIDATEAFARLRAHAFSTTQSVQEVANDVVERRIDFSTLPL